MAVDAIPPGGKVLRTVSGHSNTFMQITDTQIWKVRPGPPLALCLAVLVRPLRSPSTPIVLHMPFRLCDAVDGRP